MKRTFKFVFFLTILVLGLYTAYEAGELSAFLLNQSSDAAVFGGFLTAVLTSVGILFGGKAWFHKVKSSL